MARERILNVFGRRVSFDGVPLGAEVRAYDEALRANEGKPSEVSIIYALALAVINYRLRPPTLLTAADLDLMPLSAETVSGLRVVVQSIGEAMSGEKKATGKPNPSTGKS